MSKFIVEIIVCEYGEEGKWHADGRVVREVETRKEAVRIANVMVSLLDRKEQAGP